MSLYFDQPGVESHDHICEVRHQIIIILHTCNWQFALSLFDFALHPFNILHPVGL